MHFHVGGSIFAPSRTPELEIGLQPNIYIESHSSIRVRHHGINASCADGSKNELQRNINIGLLLTFQHRTPNSTCLGLVGRGLWNSGVHSLWLSCPTPQGRGGLHPRWAPARTFEPSRPLCVFCVQGDPEADTRCVDRQLPEESEIPQCAVRAWKLE